MTSLRTASTESFLPRTSEAALDYISRLSLSQAELAKRLSNNPAILDTLPELRDSLASPGSLLDMARTPDVNVLGLRFTETWGGGGVSKSHGGRNSGLFGTLSVSAPGSLDHEVFDLDSLSRAFADIDALGAGACWWSGFNRSGLLEEWVPEVYAAFGRLSLAQAEELYPSTEYGPAWLFLTEEEDPAEPFRGLMEQQTGYGNFVRGVDQKMALFAADPETARDCLERCRGDEMGGLSFSIH